MSNSNRLEANNIANVIGQAIYHLYSKTVKMSLQQHVSAKTARNAVLKTSL